MRKEDSARNHPKDLSAGMDEVGRGALAGPLLIAVAAFPMKEPPIEGIRDSKKTTRKHRERIAGKLVELSSYIGLGWASPPLIDSVGIEEAWQIAAMAALEGAPSFSRLVVDGTVRVRGYCEKQETKVKADSVVWQVSAASIIAKYLRDVDMIDMSSYYPHYGWEKNSGYGTKLHRDGISHHGVTPYHRKSFVKL